MGEEIDEKKEKERSRNASGASISNKSVSLDGEVSLVSSCSTISGQIDQNPYAPAENSTENIFRREPSEHASEHEEEVKSMVTVASVSSSVNESEKSEKIVQDESN